MTDSVKPSRSVPSGFVQLATRVPKSLLRDVKLHCVTVEVPLYDFVREALEEQLAGKKRRKVAADPPSAA